MKHTSLSTRVARLSSVAVSTATYLLAALPVSAQTREWSGVCTNDGTADGVATIQGLQCLLANVLSMALTLIGLAGFIMLIVGSFRYLMSGGNTKGTESARNTMTYALVGLIVALSSFVILNLISNFTGIDSITKFVVPSSDSGL